MRAGTSQAAISRIETGLEAPSPERLHDLLLVLGHSLVLEATPTRAPAGGEAVLSACERLRESASWNLVATRLELAGEEARRAGHPATRRSDV